MTDDELRKLAEAARKLERFNYIGQPGGLLRIGFVGRLTDMEGSMKCQSDKEAAYIAAAANAVPQLLNRLAAMREFVDWCKGSGMPIVEEYAARVLGTDDKAKGA